MNIVNRRIDAHLWMKRLGSSLLKLVALNAMPVGSRLLMGVFFESREVIGMNRTFTEKGRCEVWIEREEQNFRFYGHWDIGGRYREALGRFRLEGYSTLVFLDEDAQFAAADFELVARLSARIAKRHSRYGIPARADGIHPLWHGVLVGADRRVDQLSLSQGKDSPAGPMRGGRVMDIGIANIVSDNQMRSAA